MTYGRGAPGGQHIMECDSQLFNSARAGQPDGPTSDSRFESCPVQLTLEDAFRAGWEASLNPGLSGGVVMTLEQAFRAWRQLHA